MADGGMPPAPASQHRGAGGPVMGIAGNPPPVRSALEVLALDFPHNRRSACSANGGLLRLHLAEAVDPARAAPVRPGRNVGAAAAKPATPVRPFNAYLPSIPRVWDGATGWEGQFRRRPGPGCQAAGGPSLAAHLA